MKIIDLLNKIANSEEVPIKFTYKGYLWEYDKKNKMWFYYFGEGKNHRFDRLFYLNMILNDEVEILEEEKKIPEKLEDFDIQGLEVSGYSMTQAEYLLEDGVKENREMINWILDYLKNKGDE